MPLIQDRHSRASEYARNVCDELSAPGRCVCPDDSGSCIWCQAYYAYLLDAERAAKEANDG